jgi:pyocin large subunit-like protein
MKIISVILPALILTLSALACRSNTTPLAPAPPAQSAPAAARQSTQVTYADIGFRAKRNLDEHYDKHGAEFGSITKAEYLRQAQELRDRPPGGDILEAARSDGVTTRFDQKSGAFLAFNRDLTIRTYFKPKDGEAYFRRQLKRAH